jgi:hypothetical protein
MRHVGNGLRVPLAAAWCVDTASIEGGRGLMPPCGDSMMGRLNHNQGQFFYSFHLDEAVPDDHPGRGIASAALSQSKGHIDGADGG